jgi:hypothetical protein
MNRIEFDFISNSLQWDSYKRFHKLIHNGKFVVFQTGEMIIPAHGIFRPHNRQIYTDLGVTVFMAHDKHVPYMQMPAAVKELAEPGSFISRTARMPVSWLTSNVYVHDHATQRIAHLSWYRDSLPMHVPHDLQHARMYWPGAGIPPQTRSRVNLKVPYTATIGLEKKRKLREALLVCKTFARLVSSTSANPYTVMPSDNALLLKGVESLTADEKYLVGLHGCKKEKLAVDVDYLLAA